MNVMLVDDEQWTLIYLERLIDWDDHGFNLTGTFQNCSQALSAACETPPDLLFLDIKMPEMNGLEFLGELKKKGIHPHTILLSGYSEFEYARDAIRLNVVDYCLKPLSQEKLLELLLHVRELGKPAHEYVKLVDSSQTYVKIQDMIQYIQEHYGDKMNIRMLAERLHITPNYCSKLFSREIGTTFSEYLQNVRMENAAHLVRSSNRSIKEIALTCGYEDYSYFLKTFKKYFGMTVTEYRQTHK